MSRANQWNLGLLRPKGSAAFIVWDWEFWVQKLALTMEAGNELPFFFVLPNLIDYAEI
jgi:hypothetical protein